VAQAMNDILREMARSAQIYLKDNFLDQNKYHFWSAVDMELH
jgi:hypothetical protein